MKLGHHQSMGESLLNLTYADTFECLDLRMANSVSTIARVSRTALVIKEDGSNYVLAEHGNCETLFQSEQRYEYPITLSNGQQIYLLLDHPPCDTAMLSLVTLVSTYANMHEHLQRASKDRLTGLKNRHSFDIEYTRLCRDHEENDSHIIAVVDVDHFKQVNDTWGHVIGDETLVTMASLMKRFFGRGEYLYRFGGEEFVILLRHTTEKAAYERLDQLREHIAAQAFPRIGKKTISIGFVVMNPNCDSTLQFEKADAALYYAKQHGRNNVQNYHELVSNTLIAPIEDKAGEVELF